jgi:Tol biopolymer transport system component
LKGRSSPARPRWSPDGQTLAFELSVGAGTSEIDTIGLSGGEPKRVLANAGSPSWSHDGKSVYFVSDGRIGKIAAVPGAGGERLTLTDQPGATLPQESPDGKYVFFLRYGSIQRMLSGGGAEEAVTRSGQAGYILGTGRVTDKGMYYVQWNGAGRRNARVTTPNGVRFLNMGTASLMFYDFDSKESKEVFASQAREVTGLSISPDQKYVLYPRTDESATTLMLVEGFR